MEESTQLIGQLLVRAGMLMEDQSPTFVLKLPSELELIAERIGRLAQVATDLANMASAAGSLLRQAQRPD